MHRSIRLPFFALLSLAVTSLGTSRPANATQISDEQFVSDVEALVADRLQEPGSVGFSVAIARGGEMIHAEGYGRADIEHDIAADAETIFRIGSITKQFTAAAIMRLVEQGKLSLEDDITRYLPDFPTRGHTVTIRHLLTHTSGIKSYTAVDDFWRTGAALELSVDEVLAYVPDMGFNFVPGQQFKYSNTGYYILGSIIEKASGVPYCQFLQDGFFTPLSLSGTRCDSNADIIPHRAQGYGFEDGKLVNDRLLDMRNTGGAGMLVATARDLVEWKMALIGGDVVSSESLEQMITPTILPGGESTGYGFGLNPGAFRGHRAIMHGGGVFGFSALLVYFPDDDLYIAVLANVFGDRPAQSLARDIATAAFGLTESIADLIPSAEDILQFSGMYDLQDGNLQVRIFERDGYLFMQPTGEPAIKLLYQGAGEFRPSRDTSIKIIFDPVSGPDFVLDQGGRQERGIRQSIIDLSPSAEDIQQFSGTYVLQRVDLEVKIFEQDGYLFLQPTGRSATRLLYQGQGEFRASDDPATKITFDPSSGQDFVLHQGGGQVRGVRQSGQ